MDSLIDLIAKSLNPTQIHAIKEVGVVAEPISDCVRKTPVSAFVENQGYVGISSWVLPKLYAHSTSRLLKNKEDTDASKSLLLCTPDNLTAWNARKAQTTPDTVLTELEFNRLMITRAPKSAESWSHRAWLFRTFCFPPSLEQLQAELELAWFASSREPHNYYAGVHRARLLRWMNSDMIQSEREHSRKWLRTHVSDSSGWWYHRTLLANGPKNMYGEDKLERSWFCDMHERYGQNCQSIKIHKQLYNTYI